MKLAFRKKLLFTCKKNREKTNPLVITLPVKFLRRSAGFGTARTRAQS